MQKVIGFILIGFIVSFQGCSADGAEGCPEVNCSSYPTQREAQAAYDRDRVCMGALDNDNDNIACEDLPAGNPGGAGGNICPAASNCGCSGKNKDQCGGPCCRWVVGSGCKCK